MTRWTFVLMSLAFLISACSAYAACPSPFTVKDATGASQNVASVNQTGTNDCVFPNAIADGSNAGNLVAVDSGNSLKTNIGEIGGTAVVADPCQAIAKSTAAFSQTASGNIITGTTAKKNYICAIAMVASAAVSVSTVEFSGTCTGGTAFATMGSTTAANGLPLAANGGLTFGSGLATVISGGGNTNTGYNVCLLQNGSGTVAGTVTYVQQ